MNQTELSQALNNVHQELADLLQAMPDADFIRAPEGKWTPGQHGEHLRISAKLLNKALKMPLFVLRWKFGEANRPSRSYDELVRRYHERLVNAGKAPERFRPKAITLAERQQLCDKLTTEAKALARKLERFSDKTLDRSILPHPLLGYLTLREMGYFMIYHVRHHRAIVDKYAEN